MHQWSHILALGGGDQGLIVQIYQAACGGDPIGKGRQISEIGQRPLEQSLVNKGIGIAVDRQRPLLFAPVAQNQGLAGIDDALPSQIWVVLEQNANRDARLPGHSVQRIPWLDGIDRRWIPHYDGLSYRQAAGVGQLIVRHQPSHRYAVFLGDGIEAIPCLHYMDVHSRLLDQSDKVPAGVAHHPVKAD